MLLLFGLGNLFYVSILFVNAIAVLSEDRFLARSFYMYKLSRAGFMNCETGWEDNIQGECMETLERPQVLQRRLFGWSAQSYEPAFGTAGPGSSGQDPTSVKTKMINLITSVRTLMRIPLIAINSLIIIYELILG